MQGRTTRVRLSGSKSPRSSVERVNVSPESGEVVKLVPRPWFRVFFRNLADLSGAECAWRDSNPRSHRFEVCGSIH